MHDYPHLQHLTPHERDVLTEFLSRLQERCGYCIAHVWLFGSKVRGDFEELARICPRTLLHPKGVRQL